MIKIPSKLQDKRFKFIKVRKIAKSVGIKEKELRKVPSEADWKMDNNYKYNESNFIEYLKTADGYGIVCGFGKLVIVDCDNPNTAEDIMNALPETFTVYTPGHGTPHLYFIIKDMDKKILMRDNSGVRHGEALFTGFQAIGPNSLHPNGRRYEVFKDKPIAEITQKQLLEVIGQYTTSKGKEKSTKICKHDITVLFNPEDTDKWKKLNNREGEYQGINPFTNKSDGGHNFNFNTTKNQWYAWDDTSGNTIDAIAILNGIISYEDFAELRNQHKQLCGNHYAKACDIGRTKYKLPIPERKLSLMVKNTVTGKQELNIEGIVDRINEDYYFITVEDNTGNNPHLYFYENGCYIIKGLQELEKIIKKMFRKSPYQWKTWYRNEIREYVKTENVVFRDDIEPPDYLINLNNGIYDLNTRKLLPHNPKYHFLYKIPIDYNPKRKFKNSLVKKYFTTTLEPDFVKMSQELFGYCMYSRYIIHGIFYLFGPGGNGKGVWEDLLIALLGVANITTKDLHKIAGDRFTAGLLYGKLANICGEMSAKMLRNTTMLKALSAGGTVSGELKGMNGFDFRNKAKIIVSANTINYSLDKTDAWLDRQYVIPFGNKFRNIAGIEIPDLAYKITTDKEEMEILLLWALEGLHRLLKNGKFTYPGNHEEIYRLSINPERKFVYICCERDSATITPSSDIYTAFTAWCKKYHIPRPINNDELDRALTYAGWRAGERKTINKKQVYVRVGLKLTLSRELNLLESEMDDLERQSIRYKLN